MPAAAPRSLAGQRGDIVRVVDAEAVQAHQRRQQRGGRLFRIFSSALCRDRQLSVADTRCRSPSHLLPEPGVDRPDLSSPRQPPGRRGAPTAAAGCSRSDICMSPLPLHGVVFKKSSLHARDNASWPPRIAADSSLRPTATMSICLPFLVSAGRPNRSDPEDC
jgi:hypothetical protein